jgi:O-antigen ligase
MVWVFLTGSRGGTLVAAIAALYLLSAVRQTGRRTALAVLTAAVALLVAFQFSDLRDRSVMRFTRLFDPDASANSRTSGRYELAVTAWRVFLDNPLGVGSGGFPYVAGEYQEAFSLRGGPAGRLSHSAWMKTLAENGIPGFVLLLAYVTSFAVAGWRQRRRTGALPLGLLVTSCIAVAYLAVEFVPKGLWFLAAAGTVLLYRDQDDLDAGFEDELA